MYWIINTGQCYGAVEETWIAPPPEEAALLYSDTRVPGAPVVADTAFLRETVLFYKYPLGEVLKTRLDKIQAIQAEYAPLLTALQEAKSGAEMRDAAEDVADIKTEYVALLQAMNAEIQKVPND